MSGFKYPVDTDQFQRIREDGKVYVDKTDMMYSLVNKYQYVFLARPRRFGKSLLCNTFKAYFQGMKELFEGLKVMDLEKEWKTYPVLHFTMSGLKNLKVSEAKSKLESMIRGYESIYGRDSLSITPGDRFRDLIHNANKQTGERVVVILDEYDAAVMRLLYNKEQLEEMCMMLREFYQVLKDEGAYLKFVFITGVTKFSQMSIFSELNNLNQISMIDEYSGLCGITQEELNTVLRPCVEEYAEGLGISVDDAYAVLKNNYDGYHFSENSQDVYAPYSLLNALNDRATRHYWFESGTSASLIEHLKHFPGFNPLDFDGVEVALEEFNVPCENASTPVPMLYQSGYLTIDYYNKEDDVYVLHFPNYEVRQGIVYSLTNYLMDISDWDRNATILAMARALKRGDLSSALTELRSYIASLPYDIITRKEWMAKKKKEAFYKLLMYVVFSLLNSKVDTEVKSVLGRADVVVKTKNDIYVLELKVDDSVDNALAQIDTKGYAIPYEADGRAITKCGVTISSDARNITHWRAVDKDGNVIDEQKYE
ncbi:MAG: AAA family ATPase [Prevotella sp.]|nr:AAA family ATPase [Prevotellaceae bacterium]MDY5342809.1 AAA family ATPase [Prevotella sp.]